jgi:hypothetical protein
MKVSPLKSRMGINKTSLQKRKTVVHMQCRKKLKEKAIWKYKEYQQFPSVI